VASRLRLRSSTARRSKPLGKRNATAQAVEGNLGGFCVCMKNGPGTDGRTEAARVRTADRDGMGGKPDQSKFLHSDFRLPFWGDLSRP
jgi:hypothetical protein